ncbi:MAG: hypothetical protein SwBeaMacB_37710 [Shewanella algae]
MPSWQQETLSLGSNPDEVSSAVSIVRHQLNPSSGNNVLAKALDYANQLGALLRQNRDTLTLAQFRDPWAGVPLLDHRKDNPALKLVYEVNALPSIELPIHLSLPRKTLAKISAWEQRCLDGADLIVTPSKLTAAGLEKRTSTPVVYLPNGAELPPAEPLRQAEDASLPRLIYFGAAQRWQGLRDLLKAFALVRQQLEVRLDLCLSPGPAGKGLAQVHGTGRLCFAAFRAGPSQSQAKNSGRERIFGAAHALQAQYASGVLPFESARIHGLRHRSYRLGSAGHS